VTGDVEHVSSRLDLQVVLYFSFLGGVPLRSMYILIPVLYFDSPCLLHAEIIDFLKI